MVGKDKRKLTQHKKARGGKGKGRFEKPHKARAKYKTCDPDSIRARDYKNDADFNEEPDDSELDDFVDSEEDDIHTYTDYRKKPNYRRDEELSNMKEVKKEEKKHKKSKEPELFEGRLPGESISKFHRRMNQLSRQVVLEEGKKAITKSDKTKRYREKNQKLRDERKALREEMKKERVNIIKDHTVSGLKPQAERPPDLNKIIDKMIKNNKVFEGREAKPQIDRKKAMRLCRQNMDRFN